MFLTNDATMIMDDILRKKTAMIRSLKQLINKISIGKATKMKNI